MNPTDSIGQHGPAVYACAQLLRPLLSAIPRELAVVPQWVCWQALPQPDRLGKRLVSPATARYARSTEPSDWSSFEAAVRYMRARGLDGLAFAFSPADPYAGVDLDTCCDPHTGQLASWAAEYVTLLDSYTEVSPSGTGVKIILRGTLPPSGRRRDRVEMYDRAPFFTVTGHHLPGTSHSVEDRAQVIVTLHHRVFGPASAAAAVPRGLSPAPAHRPGPDLFERALWRISPQTRALLNTPGAGGRQSASEADFAVACALIAAGLTETEALAILLDSPRAADNAARKRQSGRAELAYWQRTVCNAALRIGPVIDIPPGRIRTPPAPRPLRGPHRPPAQVVRPHRPASAFDCAIHGGDQC